MAVVGVLTLELRIEHAHSLKEKRHVVKSLKDRLRNKFNVAVADSCLLITMIVRALSVERTAAKAETLSGLGTVALTLVSPNVDLFPS